MTVIDYYSRYLLACHFTHSYAAAEAGRALRLAVGEAERRLEPLSQPVFLVTDTEGGQCGSLKPSFIARRFRDELSKLRIVGTGLIAFSQVRNGYRMPAQLGLLELFCERYNQARPHWALRAANPLAPRGATGEQVRSDSCPSVKVVSYSRSTRPARIGWGVTVTSVPITLPSRATIMTGMYPTTLGVRTNGTSRLADRHTTLAELLGQRGYATAAFVSCFVLDSRFGIDQGFQDFDIGEGDIRQAVGLHCERRADEVTTSMLRWLRTAVRPQTPENDKFILAPRAEYYDLRSDPKEENNLYGWKKR